MCLKYEKSPENIVKYNRAKEIDKTKKSQVEYNLKLKNEQRIFWMFDCFFFFLFFTIFLGGSGWGGGGLQLRIFQKICLEEMSATTMNTIKSTLTGKHV